MKRTLLICLVFSALVGAAYGWDQVSPLPLGNPGTINTGAIPFNSAQQSIVESKASAHCFASDAAFFSCFGYRLGADGMGQGTTAETIAGLFTGDGQCLRSDGTRGDCGSGVTSYLQLSDRPGIPSALEDLTTDATHRLTTDAEKSTWNGKQDALVCLEANQTWEWDATTNSVKCVDWQTISADGTTISISGGVLSETGAAASGLLTVKGRNAAGVFGYLPASDFFSAGATYTIVAEAPTSASANGLKLNTANGHLYAKTDDGIFEYIGAFSAWDTVPAAFTFTDETDVALNTLKIGNEITVAEINYPSPITVTGSTGAAYQKNSSPCTSASDTVIAGDKIKPCNQTSTLNSTATATTVTIGGLSDTYTCTTLAGTSCTGDYGYNTGTTLTATSNLSMWVRKVPACSSGTVKSISARIDSYNTTGRRLMAVIYADNAGEPGALLYASAPVWNSGWGSATLRTMVSGLDVATSGANVWIGIVSEAGSASSWTRDTAQTGDMRYTTVATMETASVPAEWPTATDGTSTYSMYIYGTY